MLPRIVPIAVLVALAGCLAPAAPLETASDAAAPAAAAHAGLRNATLALTLPPASAGALLVEVGEGDWFYNEARDVYQASVLVNLAGFDPSAVVALASWVVSGSQAVAPGVVVFTGDAGDEGATLGSSLVSAAPKRVTLVLVPATDDPANEVAVRVAVVDSAVADFPPAETPAAWTLLGQGPRLSFWMANEDPAFGGEISHDVEVTDTRSTTPLGVAAAGEVTVQAAHELGAPGLHAAFAFQTSRGGVGAWEFARALDGDEETLGEEYAHPPPLGVPLVGRPLAFSTAPFHASAAASMRWDVDADFAAFRTFVAVSLPIEGTALGLTFEDSLETSGGLVGALATPLATMVSDASGARALPAGAQDHGTRMTSGNGSV